MVLELRVRYSHEMLADVLEFYFWDDDSQYGLDGTVFWSRRWWQHPSEPF